MGDPALPLVLSCEHAGNRVPRRYARHFRDAGGVLAGHRGWDPGALAVARALARRTGAPLRYSLTTRLLVDPNRSEASPELFSEFSEALSGAERARALRDHHRDPRARVRRAVEEAMAGSGGARSVLHIGVHTFTPVLEGRAREVDVGVLFDPDREREAAFALRWIRELRRHLPGLRVRANEPYSGTSDGLTTTLRGRFPPDRYLGIELELRLDLAAERSGAGRRAREGAAEALAASLVVGAPPGTVTP